MCRAKGGGGGERRGFSFDTHARWQPVTESARFRRSYGKIEDCEQSQLLSEPALFFAVPSTLSQSSTPVRNATHLRASCFLELIFFTLRQPLTSVTNATSLRTFCFKGHHNESLCISLFLYFIQVYIFIALMIHSIPPHSCAMFSHILLYNFTLPRGIFF